MHEINYENSNITERRSTGSQVSEGLMTWCVNDEVTWQLQINVDPTIHLLDMAFNVVLREVSSTDLLCDTSSLSSLHICLP